MKINLAENMLRFGVKNLNESAIQRIQLLTEQADNSAVLKKIPIAIPKLDTKILLSYIQQLKTVKQPVMALPSNAPDYLFVFNPENATYQEMKDRNISVPRADGQPGNDLIGYCNVKVYTMFPFISDMGNVLPNFGEIADMKVNFRGGIHLAPVVNTNVLVQGNLTKEMAISSYVTPAPVIENNKDAMTKVTALCSGRRFNAIAAMINTWMANQPTWATEIIQRMEKNAKQPGITGILSTNMLPLLTKPGAASNTTPQTGTTPKPGTTPQTGTTPQPGKK